MIAVLGGTFDPIHTGHLSIAKQANNLLNPDKLLFMPCKKPVHKKNAETDCMHRINMLKLATASIANSEIDLREIERNSPSYAVDSLQSLRLQYLNQPLFFIIGMDSLNTLHTWYKWQVCLEHANFLVFKRPNEIFTPDKTVSKFIAGDINEFHNAPSLSGHIYLTQNQEVAISSSSLRKKLDDNFLPDTVSHYIKQHNLYQ